MLGQVGNSRKRMLQADAATGSDMRYRKDMPDSQEQSSCSRGKARPYLQPLAGSAPKASSAAPKSHKTRWLDM